MCFKLKKWKKKFSANNFDGKNWSHYKRDATFLNFFELYPVEKSSTNITTVHTDQRSRCHKVYVEAP